ncbi:carbohydrate ABC transporter permease [Actinomyces sp. 2119]|uniref:Carbohydrate ABC transporter permease n=1 Tax=Actinomyces lilanjuaniae TaxID=2321394 RepID=A0ABM6Z300_9ACTO|nr:MULTISPECIES: carbohydrate ABC transporter permease [Actinomyces]AYD89392.1 carbohydrate ABC transporter permease [Actinomyces lilanjuaniae]RJF43253.1 carbohydrate ABC transporter permease [Actinomyces sp. 2119]
MSPGRTPGTTPDEPDSRDTSGPAPHARAVGTRLRSRSPHNRQAGTRGSTTFFVTSVLLVVSLYFLIPVLWVVVNATKTSDDLFATNGFWFGDTFVLWENIRLVLASNDSIFPRWFLNSLLYSGAGALLATYIAAAAGYALSTYRFRGRNLLLGMVMGGVLVPGTATALPLFLVFSRIGITNTYLAVLIPAVVSPFGLFLCRIYADAAVSTSLIEAGRIDGAGELTIFHRIALRQMAPALVTVFLFQFVAIWNNYFLPLIMLADERLYPVTLGLNTWLSQTDRLPEFYQLTVGGALLSVIPLAVLMLVLQRFWRGGLTEGAVKE